MPNNDALVLIDAYSQIYRSYHAIPRLTNDRGEPTNCIYGLAVFTLRMEEILPHRYGAVVFDKGIPVARTSILPEYKATRPPMPDEMHQQLEGVHEWVQAAGWAVLEEEGREADDLIAAVVQMRQSAATYIVSADKDLAQLVTDDVRLMIPGQRGKLQELGLEQVEEKWGIPPSAVCDYLALVGDASDNIKGVAGVGAKTAAKLLQQFGSIDEMLGNLHKISNTKLRDKIAASRDLLEKNRSLIRLDTTLPADWPGINTLCRRTPDWDRMRELAVYYNFTSLVQRVDKMKTDFQNPGLF